MSDIHHITSQELTLEHLEDLIQSKKPLALSDESGEKINNCRRFLDDKLANSEERFYGVNTGFGSLADVKIPPENHEELQTNLVISHASGTGEEVPEEIVKLMLFLKVQSLAYGNSGVDVETVNRLIGLYNNDVLPVVYEQGSLGASGDLAPLAHLCLPLLGIGEVNYKGKRAASADVLNELGWKPLHLKSKEGLALLNGTQFMSAYGCWCLLKARKLSLLADLISAASLDAFNCKLEPLEGLIHDLRPHAGQLRTAENIRHILKGSEIAEQEKKQTQDSYSFRCIPQVHGASRDAIDYVAGILLTEINAVTDNPNIFPEEDKILSGGNFHGQPLALGLDFLCIALAELGSISERRTYKLVSGERGLPPFLVNDPGLHSGLMMPQYTAAAIVSQNKQLCTPASVDSITSCNGQEDHVSMGANAATKAYRVTQNVETILAIEFLNAAQALEFRRPLKSSDLIEKIINGYRKVVSFNDKDRLIREDIMRTVEFLARIDLKSLS